MRGLTALHLLCVAVLLFIVGGACGGPAPSPLPSSALHGGGTLRIGLIEADFAFPEEVYVDPGRVTRAFFMRCCLARTLLTYPGETTADGGTVLLPDLAVRMPDVSRDGLTWTFQIREGITYAPPHDSIEVTSADFVTAVERSIRINQEVFPPLLFVAGTQEFLEGSAATVSGLETPDEHTLVIRLTEQFGALDFLADVVWSPIPASVAAGHDDDLAFYWPSTGPYMYQTYPADPNAPVAALVRNPQWKPETDTRRRALVDQIEIRPAGATLAEALPRLDSAEFDFLSTRLDEEHARRYRSDPAATGRLRSTSSEYLYRLPMNLALPPFDDLAVRRAVIFALDRVAARDAIVAALEANGTAQPATLLSAHPFADSTTGGLLLGYDPFTLGDGRGNLSRARTEMARSHYDTNKDGECDAEVCAAITLPTFDAAAGQAIARSLEGIGLNIEPVNLEEQNDISLPVNRTGIAVLPFGWGFDLTGTELAVLVAGGEGLASDGFAVNSSLVGARAEDLGAWGYDVTEVPAVDDIIDRCEREFGNRRARCWAELDQLVAESVAPWVPLFTFESVWVSSARVADYTLDQATFQQFPALDKVSLIPGPP
jgi:ABC-type transport system substrate-binding protein